MGGGWFCILLYIYIYIYIVVKKSEKGLQFVHFNSDTTFFVCLFHNLLLCIYYTIQWGLLFLYTLFIKQSERSELLFSDYTMDNNIISIIIIYYMV